SGNRDSLYVPRNCASTGRCGDPTSLGLARTTLPTVYGPQLADYTVRGSLSRCEKDIKDAAKRDAFNLWLACKTQEEIAEAVGWPRQSVTDWLRGIAEKDTSGEFGNTDDSDDSPLKLTKAELALAEHATEFAPPTYNIGKQQEKSQLQDS